MIFKSLNVFYQKLVTSVGTILAGIPYVSSLVFNCIIVGLLESWDIELLLFFLNAPTTISFCNKTIDKLKQGH